MATYPKQSVRQVRTKIDNAVDEAEGGSKIPFLGANAIASMLSNLLDLLADGRLMYAPDATALGQLGGVDGQYAVVPGKAVYRFNPNASSAVPDTSVPGQAGVWNVLFVAPGAPYIRQIGDSINDTIDIPHKKDTLTPSVTVFINNPVTGERYEAATDYTWRVVDADTIRIISDTVWGSLSRTVVVKP